MWFLKSAGGSITCVRREGGVVWSLRRIGNESDKSKKAETTIDDIIHRLEAWN